MKNSAIRLRTIMLSVIIIITLIFYLMVNVITKQEIDFIDFLIMAVLQIVVQAIYFPDGEIFGQLDKTYTANRDAYNEKATKINQDGNFSKLRDYCEYEYQKRKQDYISNECAFIGITEKELENLKAKDIKEIKSLKHLEIDGKFVVLTKKKRKHLVRLIFEKIPIEKNQPETIMSAIENNGHKAISDKSKFFKTITSILTVFKAFVVGGFLAYIGYTAKDGIGIAEFVKMLVYLTTIVTTAVTSFSGGERNTKVYKKQFYVELSNFIDGFDEWVKAN